MKNRMFSVVAFGVSFFACAAFAHAGVMVDPSLDPTHAAIDTAPSHHAPVEAQSGSSTLILATSCGLMVIAAATGFTLFPRRRRI